jgi:hypothetical protein
MNTKKTIYSKLFTEKVELAKHEVELALADDVKKAYNEAIAARKKSFDEYQKLRPIIAAALKMQIDLQSINSSSLPIFDKYEIAAKELGLPLPKEIADQKKNIQDGLKGTFAANVKALQSIKL